MAHTLRFRVALWRQPPQRLRDNIGKAVTAGIADAVFLFAANHIPSGAQPTQGQAGRVRATLISTPASDIESRRPSPVGRDRAEGEIIMTLDMGVATIGMLATFAAACLWSAGKVFRSGYVIAGFSFYAVSVAVGVE